MGLVIWNLARRGIECQATTQNSNSGDIWAKLPGGRTVAIEVKGTGKAGWHIREAQARRVDWFALVSIHDARCWVLTRAEMLDCPHHELGPGVWVVSRSHVPTVGADAWDRLTKAPAPKPKAIYRTQRLVRRTLADGTIKEYRYGPAPAFS